MSVVAQKFEADADLSALVDHPRNPRRGDDASVAASIDRNGWYGAIIAQSGTRRILAGHTRRRALTAAGATSGPVLWVDCDDETALAILLADNRTAELAAWDEPSLLELLNAMPSDALIGFTSDDVDTLARIVDARGAGTMDRNADYADEWAAAGMPEYGDDDLKPAYKATVAFRTEDDADRFFESIDRPKTRKTFWWPEDDGFVGRDGEQRIAVPVEA